MPKSHFDEFRYSDERPASFGIGTEKSFRVPRKSPARFSRLTIGATDFRSSELTNWNNIVREYGPGAYRVAWRILGHAQDCEDVVQEVFVEAHELFARGKIKHWPAFLNRLVTFRALDALRRRKQVGVLDDELVYDPSPGPEEAAIYRETERRLRAAVAELPDRQAAVFCLAYFEQLSHQDIAAALDITKNAVANAFHKARAHLRESLSTRAKEEPGQ